MLLRDAGYRTAVIGKWGLGTPGTTGQPDKKGFDYSFGFLDHRHAHRQYTDHLYRNAERIATDLDRDYVNDLFTREAESFITAADPKPFFLYLNYTVPHAELRAPDDSMAPFAGRFPETPFVDEKADARQAGATIEGATLRYRSQPTPHAAFAAMITRMDRDIARLTALVGARKLDRHTLILFVSDNGPHREGGADPAFFKSSGGLRGIKRDLYEGGIRVPMIARWVGTIPAGRVSDHVWAHWDMLPTLAEIAGATPPPRHRRPVDGARAARAQRQPTHDFLYWEFHERGFQQAVRMGDWKAVRLKKDAPLELYDLARDPNEQHDVAAAHPDVVADDRALPEDGAHRVGTLAGAVSPARSSAGVTDTRRSRCPGRRAAPAICAGRRASGSRSRPAPAARASPTGRCGRRRCGGGTRGAAASPGRACRRRSGRRARGLRRPRHPA